jgi:hypothetical protein
MFFPRARLLAAVVLLLSLPWPQAQAQGRRPQTSPKEWTPRSGATVRGRLVLRHSRTRLQNDMAVWIHPREPTFSVVITADEEAGLLSLYDMTGQLLQSIPAPGAGALDLRYDVDLGNGRRGDVVVALNPATPVSLVEYLVPGSDGLMLMTVNPGFAGQTMVPYAIDKIRDARKLVGDDKRIQVDGNVSMENIPGMVAAGADMLVAGSSSIFRDGMALDVSLREVTELIAND